MCRCSKRQSARFVIAAGRVRVSAFFVPMSVLPAGRDVERATIVSCICGVAWRGLHHRVATGFDACMREPRPVVEHVILPCHPAHVVDSGKLGEAGLGEARARPIHVVGQRTRLAGPGRAQVGQGTPFRRHYAQMEGNDLTRSADVGVATAGHIHTHTRLDVISHRMYDESAGPG